MKKLLLLAALTSQLAACGYAWKRDNNVYPPAGSLPAGTPSGMVSTPLLADEYIVQPGDTAASIARAKGLTINDLAGWNRLGRDYAVVPGQLLRLSPPPLSAAGGTVAYPTGEGSMQATALPTAPLGSAMSLPSSAPVAAPAAVPVAAPVYQSAQPITRPSPPPAYAEATAPYVVRSRPAVPENTSRSSVGKVGYSAIAPSAVPIIAPVRAGVMLPSVQPQASAPPLPVQPPPRPVAPTVVSPKPVAVKPPAIPPPAVAEAPSSGSAAWRWPVSGTVVKTYAPAAGSKGVDISVDLGTPVRAAAAGRVAYSGSALKGYGELVVIKHDEVYLTAYGYNRKRLVKEGEQVKAGQVIAESGIGPEQNTVVHFEIRENGNPVNPLPLLPANP